MIDEVILICLFVLITGACIGSFLNVVSLRAISKESIVFPPSKCPLCAEPIKWYDNIPIISYLFTFKGKCRNCGGKVSLQYPIIETVTAVLFLAVFIAFGFTVKTLLLLILLSISIVIMITDFRKNEVYDVHSWILIAAAIVYSLYTKGLDNYAQVAIGLIAGVFAMEAVARLAYYLVRKKVDKEKIAASEENKQSCEEIRECSIKNDSLTEDLKETAQSTEKNIDLGNDIQKNTLQEHADEENIIEENNTAKGVSDEDNAKKDNTEEINSAEYNNDENSKCDIEEEVDINKYVEENKRAFGEGDTYLAAATGALLGWKYLLVSIAFAVILQAVCIFPKFLIGLYKQKEYKLLVSLSAFAIIAILYWILSNIFTLHIFLIFAFVIALIIFAIDTITRLKKTVNNQGFIAIPFGPALLCSAFLILFYGNYIVSFLKRHIFMIPS